MSLEVKIIFSLFLLCASWQDWRRKMIPVWLYVAAGVSGLLCRLLFSEELMVVELFSGASVGLGLLGISVMTEGAVGDGDGWFFVVTGILLGFWKNLALLFYGLLACCTGSCFLIVWRYVWGEGTGSVRKYQFAFVPFLLPIGIWMVLYN